MAKDFPMHFDRINSFTPEEQRVLDSVRYQDQDQSIKAGAVLAFSGLIIATAIVQLSSGKPSLISVGTGSGELLYYFFSLMALFGASLLSLVSLISTRKYSSSASEALAQFYYLIQFQKKLIFFSAILSIIGSGMVLFSLFEKLMF